MLWSVCVCLSAVVEAIESFSTAVGHSCVFCSANKSLEQDFYFDILRSSSVFSLVYSDNRNASAIIIVIMFSYLIPLIFVYIIIELYKPCKRPCYSHCILCLMLA